MKIVRILLYGIKQKRLVSTVYLIQFALAITVGLQVYQVLDASIGHSLTLEGLRLGNAHMVVNDLLNIHGASLSPIIGQVRWLILIYLILAAFIHAGIWHTVIHDQKHSRFWEGGSTFFSKFLSVGLIYLILFFILSALIWLPFFVRFGYWMENLPSEVPLVWGMVGLFIIWSLTGVYLFVSSSYSRIFVIRDNRKVMQSIWSGLKSGCSQTFFLFPILLIFLVVIIALYALHSFIDDWRILSSSIGIIILFAMQQLIVWLKIAMRVSVYRFILDKSQSPNSVE